MGRVDYNKRASELGLSAEYQGLKDLRKGLGLTSPDLLLDLPRLLRVELGIDEEPTASDLTKALRTLVAAVRTRSEQDQLLAVVAWNLQTDAGPGALPDPPHAGTDEWLARCRKAASDFRLTWVDEKSVRMQCDRVVFEVLIHLVSGVARNEEPGRPMPSAISGHGSLADAFFSESYVNNSAGFRSAMSQASTITMLGYSHNRMAVTFAEDLGRLLDAGGRVRVLMLDPEDPIIFEANERSYAPKATENVRHQHAAAAATLSALGARSTSAQFELRLMKRLPPFTVYLFDEDDPEKGEAYVWLTPWRRPSGQRPGFRLGASVDSDWFSYFKQQVDSLWDHYGPEKSTKV